MKSTRRTVWRTVVRDGAVLLTVVALLGVIFAHRSALRDRDERLAGTTDKLLRLVVVDRLVGVQLPPVNVTGSDGSSVEFGEAVRGGGAWVLAPRECTGCLDDVDEWNVAGLVDERRVLLVLTGVSLEEGRRLAALAGVRIPFAVDEGSALRRVLGLSLPSTHLAVAEDRTVVTADAGSESMRCRAGFPSRLNYIDRSAVSAETPYPRRQAP